MEENITPIGTTNYQNKALDFGIKQSDRAGHIYCIGKTGTGKSTLLLNMAIDDINKGNGVGIIDPHGDLCEAILNYIPRHRIKDVIYFNATDTTRPIAFNPLHRVDNRYRYLIASALVNTLKKIWVDSWGPRLEHILRNTLLTLTYSHHGTLLDIVPLLTNPEFRKKILYSVDDKSIHDFWFREYEPLSPHQKNEVISPIVNKVGLFATHPVIRNIVGQKKSTFNALKLMNDKKILIANLSKGTLGEEGTQLIGSLLVTQFQTASLLRARQPENTRYPFYLYIDEMHSFMTLSFADILSESRKYGLSLFLAHQFTGQLEEPLLKAILGNIGTVISFRVGTQDAILLKDEFHPVFSETDLINIPQYCIYIKLLIDGTTSQPFSAKTKTITHINHCLKDEIVLYSRDRYGRSENVYVKEKSMEDRVQRLFD